MFDPRHPDDRSALTDDQHADFVNRLKQVSTSTIEHKTLHKFQQILLSIPSLQ